MYDCLIIGAGVTGCAVARELSRYDLKLAILEKEEDVCCGTSKANSAIIHAGFDALPGTLKARLNVEGNQRMEELCAALDVPFTRNGSLVLCLDSDDPALLEALLLRGRQNGVPGLRIVSGAEMKAIEPGISDDTAAFLYAPTGGIVCPFELTLALAENAVQNGAAFFPDTTVLKIRPLPPAGQEALPAQEKEDEYAGGWEVQTSAGIFHTRTIINAAGVYADKLHNMVSEAKIHITPRRGEYCLLDKTAGALTSHTLFQLPGPLGKGILVTPTVHGNLLIGPTAENLRDKTCTATSAAGLAAVLEKGQKSLAAPIPRGAVITSFAGLRASGDTGDFILGEAADAPGFFDAAGIESPGLTAAPAIGVFLAGQIAQKLQAAEKSDFKETRKGIFHAASASKEEWHRQMAEDPAYGNIICRCETVTEGEIVASIHRTPGARSLDGVKRRTRAGMGRCQSGFCAPRVMEILERERHLTPLEVTKHGAGSELLTGYAGSLDPQNGEEKGEGNA